MNTNITPVSNETPKQPLDKASKIFVIVLTITVMITIGLGIAFFVTSSKATENNPSNPTHSQTNTTPSQDNPINNTPGVNNPIPSNNNENNKNTTTNENTKANNTNLRSNENNQEQVMTNKNQTTNTNHPIGNESENTNQASNNNENKRVEKLVNFSEVGGHCVKQTPTGCVAWFSFIQDGEIWIKTPETPAHATTFYNPNDQPRDAKN